MEPTLKHLANRVRIDTRLLEKHPEQKELLEKRLQKNKNLIIQYVVENYADN